MKLRRLGPESQSDTANDRWRMWLLTGVRREPVDRRRIRGSHVGLKRMLVEGMKISVDRPYSWKEFSDAMVRQSVGEAMHSMPRQDAQLVKLAYFGGMTNREIAADLDLAEATVERRLRKAVDAIGRYIERGRGIGQRVLATVAVWLTGRWINDAIHNAAPATAVAAAAAAIMLVQSDAPASASTPSVLAPTTSAPAATHVVPVPTPTVPLTPRSSVPQPPSAVAPVAPVLPQAPPPPVQAPAVEAPTVSVPTVSVPPLPSLPKVKKVL